jgi:hypothetical protein
MRVVLIFLSLLWLAPLARAGDDALAEVNAARAARGLPPFQRDDGLTAAAMRAADFRAERLLEGHSGNDFAFLPAGVGADAAGCAAWPQGMGWGSCCSWDSYSHAGAAVTVGRDGRRFMHLFVRHGGPTCSSAGCATSTVTYRETSTVSVQVSTSSGCGQSVQRQRRLFGRRRGRCG